MSSDMRTIDEYPFTGRIYHVKESSIGDDLEIDVYNGKMDVNLLTDEQGTTTQTATYIVSIPLPEIDGKYVNPVRKNHIIECDVYGETFRMEVDNYIPSNLGGITIYATRKGF